MKKHTLTIFVLLIVLLFSLFPHFFAFSLGYSEEKNGNILFQDDFSNGLYKWISFGDPMPTIKQNMGNPAPSFNNNGDSGYDSGAVSTESFNPAGTVLEGDIYIKAHPSDCWTDCAFGFEKPNAQYSDYCAAPFSVFIEYRYDGDACWATPANEREHGKLKVGLLKDDGTSEGKTWINDNLLNAWHHYKIVILPDRHVKFYVDGSLIYSSISTLSTQVDNVRLLLGRRSYDGDSLIDNVKLSILSGGNFNSKIWVDRGCGATYSNDEAITVYFKSDKSGSAYILDHETSGDTKQFGPWNISAGQTYSLKGTVSGPEGTETLELHVNATDGTSSQSSCSFYIENAAPQHVNVKLWLDKGCGATYCVGDKPRAYFEVDQDVPISMFEYMPDGTVRTIIDHKQCQANVEYYVNGKASTPLGKRTLKVVAYNGNKEIGSVTCSFTVKNCNAKLNISKAVDKSTAKVGDILTYTITYSNTGSYTASNIKVVDSIPSGTEYVKGSAEFIDIPNVPHKILFSHDGGNSYNSSDTLPVVTIRWDSASISANKSVKLQFKVKVTDNSNLTLKNTAYLSADGLDSPISSSAITKIQEIKKPSPTQNLKATVYSDKIVLSWDASAQGIYPIAGYAIYRSTTSGGESSTPIATVDASVTTYTDNNLTLGTTYYYYVEAFDNQDPANYSEPSSEVSVTFKRLPVVLVHGFQPKPFFNPEDIWKKMATVLSGNDSGINIKNSNYSYNLWYFKAKDSEHFDVYISDYTHKDHLPTTKSISYYAQNLLDELSEVEKREHCSKVNIVAHSMGGLVARAYIESKDFGPDHYRNDVNNLIMIGTPNHGTILANKWATKIPVSACAKQMITTSDFLKKLNKGATCKDKNVNYYTFAGELLAYDNSNATDTTTTTITLPKDSVVLEASVRLSNSEAPGVTNYIVQYSDHSGLINDGTVCNTVKDILSGKNVSWYIINTNQRILLSDLDTKYQEFCEELEVHCPVNVTVKDENGRIINTQGVNQIAGAYVEVIGDEKFFYLPVGQTFTIELNSYGQGEVSLEMLYINVDTKSISVTAFKGIPINNNTKIVSSAVRPNDTNFILNVDSDGNGTFDYQKTPDLVGEVSKGTYTITATAGLGGSISPSGSVAVNYGSSQTFTITPYPGYKISAVKVDGNSKGSISSYTFTNIASDHTISAIFERKKTETVITLQPDNPYMAVNGVMKEIDPGRGTKPVIIPKWGRTVVPIRAIVEALGGTIGWDGTERKVTISFNDTVIELWIDKPQAEVNGVEEWIDSNNHDVMPIIINGRTMLPLRFVAESLGCTVNWDVATRTVIITYTP